MSQAGETLKPCPFCGNGAELIESTEDGITFCVCCNECYCNVGEAYNNQAEAHHVFDNAEEAIAAWNTRAVNSHEVMVEALTALMEAVMERRHMPD